MSLSQRILLLVGCRHSSLPFDLDLRWRSAIGFSVEISVLQSVARKRAIALPSLSPFYFPHLFSLFIFLIYFSYFTAGLFVFVVGHKKARRVSRADKARFSDPDPFCPVPCRRARRSNGWIAPEEKAGRRLSGRMRDA